MDAADRLKELQEFHERLERELSEIHLSNLQLEAELLATGESLDQYQLSLATLDEEFNQHTDTINEQDNTIQAQSCAISTREEFISSLRNILAEKDITIESIRLDTQRTGAFASKRKKLTI